MDNTWNVTENRQKETFESQDVEHEITEAPGTEVKRSARKDKRSFIEEMASVAELAAAR